MVWFLRVWSGAVILFLLMIIIRSIALSDGYQIWCQKRRIRRMIRNR